MFGAVRLTDAEQHAEQTGTTTRLVRLIVRRRWLVLAATAVVVAVSVVLALRLRLVTDLAALLPRDDPAVRATQRVQDRLGGTTPLQIAIQGPDRATNLAYATSLVDALRAEPRLIEHAAYEIHAERRFFERTWWLYVDLADLEAARDRLEREITWRKNPLLVDLEADGDSSLDDLEARLRGRTRHLGRFPDGYFMSPDGRLVVVVAWPPEALFRERAGEAVVARVRQLVTERPLGPGMRVDYYGTLYDAIVERRALQSDLAWTSIACIVLVGLAVGLFYGRLRAVPLMAIPALCGVALAFAVGSLAFGELNASTAFLGSIILGSGINTAIIQLARYEEERRAGATLDVAIERSVTTTIRGTATAALAAAIAYGSLTLTEFRGFSQFGVIGAVGMVAAWLATIAVLPALLATIDRNRDPSRVRRGIAFGVPFAKLAHRAPVAITVTGVLVTLVAIAVLVPYARDPFEYDLRRLRSVQAAERRALGQRVEAILGTSSPTVLLAETPAQAAQIAAVLRARSAAHPGVIGEMLTIDRIVPGTRDEQRAKLARLAEIRDLLDDPALPDADATRLAKWKPPADLAVITADDVPAALARPFRDVTGELAPVVLVYRSDRISYWNGHDLVRLASLARSVELPDGSTAHAGGSAVVFASMIEAITRAGPLATLVSFLGVALLVLLLARGLRGAIVVLAALVTGVAWMAGAAALAGVRVNFLNFIVLPLTFGIGVDYAANVYLRHRLEGAGRIVETLRATGGAVALCSLTTTIGYASLLFADSQGLRSFGALAILGELSCLAVALLVMPSWLLLAERRAR